MPDAKLVLLTAYADTDVAIRAINDIGLDHYLMKPWDPPEEHLYPVLDDLLDVWTRGYHPAFHGIRVAGSKWSPQSHAVKDFFARTQTRTPTAALLAPSRKRMDRRNGSHSRRRS